MTINKHKAVTLPLYRVIALALWASRTDSSKLVPLINVDAS